MVSLQLECVREQLLSLLKKCLLTKPVQQIHTQMLIHSIQKPNFLLSKIIDLKHYNYASLVFHHIPIANEYAFNVMIRGLTTTWRKHTLALHLYSQMKSLGLKPNNFTYPFVFIACANLLALDHGLIAHSSVFKLGLYVDDHISHSLITMYARCGQLESARKVFDEIPVRDLVSWNSMISGYSKMGYARDAVELFGEMRELGFRPDEMTLVSVLGSCGDSGDLGLGRWIEGFVRENRMELNSFMVSALIDMYGKCGEFVCARRVFDGMLNKDVVTWNAMITVYVQNGLSNEAIQLFNCMKEDGISPDKVTLIGVLSACASIGALDLGKRVDLYASEIGLQDDIYVATALIDMHAKCGSIDSALRVFEGIPLKNVASWNAMISAFAFHGQASKALSLFERMLKEDGPAHANEITFVAVLSACVHGGLVNEGRRLFHLMSSLFGLTPKIEHYSCLIDLLARAGRLHDALELIEKMPEKPDEIVLGSLLGACQKQKNISISHRVVQLLEEIKPTNSGNYVISSKLYANLRMWDESAKMRVLMKQKGINKTPGCSWIQMGDQILKFHAGIDSHSQNVSQMFDFLNKEMVREGYIPNAESA